MKNNILIAGNNIKKITVLRKSLELFQGEFSVSTSSNSEIIKKIKTGTIPDLIILNFDPPFIDSINTLRKINYDSRAKSIPVLMATDFLSSEIQQAISAGADDFIKKPVERVELLIRIKYLIQRNQLHQENIRKSSELKIAKEKLIMQNQDLVELTVSLEQINKKLEDQQKEINKQKKVAENQKKIADDLLLNIFPYEIAEQLKVKGYATPKHYRHVSIMFTDFVDFSKLSDLLSIHDLIRELSMYFEKFDSITKSHFIEKIKTIGDSYMCAGGLPIRNRSNPIDTALAALEIQKFVKEANIEKEKNNQPKWDIRVGIHTGEVIAGVIGKSKMAYDIWGDAVNTASRMESSGEVNMINISGSTYEFINKYFNCTYRGKVEVRNLGGIDMYFLHNLKKEFCEDDEGYLPNRNFKRILAEI